MKYFDALLSEVRQPPVRPGICTPKDGAEPPPKPPKGGGGARTDDPAGPPKPPKRGRPGPQSTFGGFGGDRTQPLSDPDVLGSPTSPDSTSGGFGGGPAPAPRRSQAGVADEHSPNSFTSLPAVASPLPRLVPPRQRSGKPLATRPAPIPYSNPIRAGLRARTQPENRVADRTTEPDQVRLDALTLPPAWDARGFAEIRIGDRTVPYSVWDGQRLTGDVLGFDTETAPIVEGKVPPLALASASSGSEHCLIHPDRLGAFVRLHGDRHLVFHNVAFDFWVVAEHLAARGEAEALEAWWQIADADRMHDAMLLDELIRLARNDAHPRPRNLAEVAAEYAGLEVDKDDPFRLRYDEIIGKDWQGVGRGFFEYAIKDPIATLAAYAEMRRVATELMKAYGHDPSRRG